MLCDDKFFTGNSFPEQLEVAYEDFMAFTRAKKNSHSQKMFTQRLVSQTKPCVKSILTRWMLWFFLFIPELLPPTLGCPFLLLRLRRRMANSWWQERHTTTGSFVNGFMMLCDVLAWALLTQGCPFHIWWWHLAENSWAQKKLWDTPYVDRLDHKMQEKSLSTDDPENEKCFPVWFQQPVTKPRNGMARFFGIMERCPRFLSLDWSHACMHFFRVLEILIADGTPRKVLFLQYCHEIWSISDYYIHARCFGSSMTTFHAKYLFFAAWHEVSWASGSPG